MPSQVSADVLHVPPLHQIRERGAVEMSGNKWRPGENVDAFFESHPEYKLAKTADRNFRVAVGRLSEQLAAARAAGDDGKVGEIKLKQRQLTQEFTGALKGGDSAALAKFSRRFSP